MCVPLSLSRIMIFGLLLGTVLSVGTFWFHNMFTLSSRLVWTVIGACHTSVYLIKNNQRDAALSSLICYSLRDHSTFFGCSLHPSSGVHKTVVTTTCTSRVLVWCRFKSVKSSQGRVSTSLCHGQIRPAGLQAYLDLLDTYERIHAHYYTSLSIGKLMLLKYDM
jgi:hypothetical protein